MRELDVSARLKNKDGTPGTPVTVKFRLGENLEELQEQYGHDVIYNHAKSSIIVALQGYMRSKIDPDRDEGPLDQEALQADISGDGSEERPGWRPGVRQPGKSAAERVKEQFSKMDPDLRRQLLQELAGGSGSSSDDEEEEVQPAARRGRR